MSESIVWIFALTLYLIRIFIIIVIIIIIMLAQGTAVRAVDTKYDVANRRRNEKIP